MLQIFTRVVTPMYQSDDVVFQQTQEKNWKVHKEFLAFYRWYSGLQRNSSSYIFRPIFSQLLPSYGLKETYFKQDWGYLHHLSYHYSVPIHSNYDCNRDTSSAILALWFCLDSRRAAYSASSLPVTYLACKISGSTDRF